MPCSPDRTPPAAIDARTAPYRRRLLIVAALTLAVVAGLAMRLGRPLLRVFGEASRLRRQARTDSLTGLLNRRAFDDKLAREVEGFIFNRLQGALLREAYCLVRDGVVTAEGVDRAVRDGLERRWAVVGPFETVSVIVECGGTKLLPTGSWAMTTPAG